MDIVEMITNKRNGLALTTDEIEWIVSSYVSGAVPDYQISALLMAVYFQGMNRDELLALTRAMVYSGETIDLSDIPGIKVDKHSTGGVGDKVSLALAPLVAAAGVPVPMMSGRGLGHTGGTLDKLESIPGFQTQLSEAAFKNQIGKIGFAMLGQTEKICPADRKIYALRDVTATVPSIPLICSSIISKKKAEGTDALVLDVKVGKGAFFPDKKQTLKLARFLVRLGNDFDLNTVALLTAMDQPLGHAVGNWLETVEAIEVLQGGGPPDLIEVTETLGGVMIYLGEKADSVFSGIEQIRALIRSGEGFRKFLDMVEMQGGDLSVVQAPDSYPKSTFEVAVKSNRSGAIQDIDARKIGRLSINLGAGRLKKEDEIDYRAGLIFHRKIGDPVQKGDVVAVLYTEKEDFLEEAERSFLDAIAFSDKEIRKPETIERYLTAEEEMPFHKFLKD